MKTLTLAQAQERIEELEQENEALQARLDEIAGIAAPDAIEERKAFQELISGRMEKLESMVIRIGDMVAANQPKKEGE